MKPFDLPLLSDIGNRFRDIRVGLASHRAATALGRLDGMTLAHPKSGLFLSTVMLKEAQHSNAIEGTHTNFCEVMGQTLGVAVASDRKNDVRKVLDCYAAMQAGLAAVFNEEKRLTSDFVQELHFRLMGGPAEPGKSPGMWRDSRVCIGRVCAGIQGAVYIPPDPERVVELMEDWIEFSRREDINPLVQAAVMHAQFELVHPFMDGNGRMGRLLVLLWLACKKEIITPCFCMSPILHAHRDEYYAALKGVSADDDWEGWIRFYLDAVARQAKDGIDTFVGMNALYERTGPDFVNATGSQKSLHVLDYVFAKPIFTMSDMLQSTKHAFGKQVATQMLGKLQSSGHVRLLSQGTGRRPGVWMFPPVLELFGLQTG